MYTFTGDLKQITVCTKRNFQESKYYQYCRLDENIVGFKFHIEIIVKSIMHNFFTSL